MWATQHVANTLLRQLISIYYERISAALARVRRPFCSSDHYSIDRFAKESDLLLFQDQLCDLKAEIASELSIQSADTHVPGWVLHSLLGQSLQLNTSSCPVCKPQDQTSLMILEAQNPCDESRIRQNRLLAHFKGCATVSTVSVGDEIRSYLQSLDIVRSRGIELFERLHKHQLAFMARNVSLEHPTLAMEMDLWKDPVD